MLSIEDILKTDIKTPNNGCLIDFGHWTLNKHKAVLKVAVKIDCRTQYRLEVVSCLDDLTAKLVRK